MIPPNANAPLVHGGDVDAARRQFPGAPEPFLDLSTGINPNPYPLPALDAESYARLPAAHVILRLRRCAAAAYGAPSETNVVPASGTQILMSLLAMTRGDGRAAILGPTYAEHARVASLAGLETETMANVDALATADLAIVVNPNNPDGRICTRGELKDLANRLRERNGLLLVDEAFMDVAPREESLATDVADGNIIVLRSFGKFFGLAGVRLGFALAPEHIAARLRAALGPWSVSGAACEIGHQALSDKNWVEGTRATLSGHAARLEALLAKAGLRKVGGTPLFVLVEAEDALARFERLGRAGIYVRRFPESSTRLRFGLPGPEEAWRRLEIALRD